MPSRTGFIVAMIIIAITLLVNIIIYPRLAPYLHPPMRRRDLRLGMKEFRSRKYYVFAIWFFSGLIITIVILMVFFLNV